MRVRELTDSVYGMLYFGGDQLRRGGNKLVGNVGLRLVRTQEDASGNVAVSDGDPCSMPWRPAARLSAPTSVVNPSCYLHAGDSRIAKRGRMPGTYSSSHVDALPSLNLPLV